MRVGVCAAAITAMVPVAALGQESHCQQLLIDMEKSHSYSIKKYNAEFAGLSLWGYLQKKVQDEDMAPCAASEMGLQEAKIVAEYANNAFQNLNYFMQSVCFDRLAGKSNAKGVLYTEIFFERRDDYGAFRTLAIEHAEEWQSAKGEFCTSPSE